MKITITSLLVPAAILLLAACDVKDPIHDPEPPVKVTVVTEELPALTVKRDSFATSSPRMLLLGRTDDITGVTLATPYFTLSPPSGGEVRADHVYDFPPATAGRCGEIRPICSKSTSTACGNFPRPPRSSITPLSRTRLNLWVRSRFGPERGECRPFCVSGSTTPTPSGGRCSLPEAA